MTQISNKSRCRGIDVIIRVHTITRQLELDRALFSLINQTFQPVHPVIVTQGFDAEAIKVITSLVEKYDWLSYSHCAPSIVNVDDPAGADLRSTLLNVGIANGCLRYIGFLDSDDYLYEHAYDFLIKQAEVTGSAISFGGVVRRDVNVFDRFVFNLRTRREQFSGTGLNDLLVGNFCPIHSFIVDRHRIDDEDLWFDPALTRLEDYDFLLRICSKYNAFFESRSEVIGVYNWHQGGEGTIEFYQDSRLPRHLENRRLWNQARRRIWRRKCIIRDQVGRLSRG